MTPEAAGAAGEAFFLPRDGAPPLFCLHHQPRQQGPGGQADAGAARALVLYMPPWADEMNKSRRMARLQSQVLAAQGFAVLQVDPTGCGDSGGEHCDATWDQWVQDAIDGLQWLTARYRAAPLLLWGLRSGCLLACAAAARWPAPVSLLMWNPPGSGKLLWQQFTRLATAAALTGEAGKARAETVKQGLQNRERVEIAGYEVGPSLYEGLAASVLTPPQGLRAAAMLETSAQADADLSPGLVAMVEKWRMQGCAVHTARVTGPAFWQTAEMEDAPELLPATLQAALQLTAHQPAGA